MHRIKLLKHFRAMLIEPLSLYYYYGDVWGDFYLNTSKYFLFAQLFFVFFEIC